MAVPAQPALDRFAGTVRSAHVATQVAGIRTSRIIRLREPKRPAKDALATVTNNSRLSVNQIPSPRLAATIILARGAPHGFELYMTRRSLADVPLPPMPSSFPAATVDARDFAAEVERSHR